MGKAQEPGRVDVESVAVTVTVTVTRGGREGLWDGDQGWVLPAMVAARTGRPAVDWTGRLLW